MASTPAFHGDEEAKLLEQDEGPIASRLRSRFKTGDVNTDVNNQTGKPTQLSRHQKDESNNSPLLSEKREGVQTVSTSTSSCIATCLSLKNEGAMNSENSCKTCLQNQHAKSKASDQPPRSETESKNQEPKKIESSVTNMSNTGGPSSDNVEKAKEKTRPSKKKQAKQSINKHPIYYIRWKGHEKTSKCWNCALCEKDMASLANEEEGMHSRDEENELQYSLFSHVEEERGFVFPEASVLACSHVFHSMCLSTALQLTANQTDPPCPICLSTLET